MELQELIDKYPKIFDKSTYTLGWWIPDTWISLVDKLCQNLQSWCNTQPPESQIICEQMKEKFGALRFYINSAPNNIHSLIDQCERESRELCQECGCNDCKIVRTKGWITYLCEPCAIKLQKEYDQI